MKDHSTLATENFKLALATFEGEAPSREWRITFLFYAALHAVNHALALAGQPSDDLRHDTRGSEIRGHRDLRTIERQYGQLKDLATTARYLPDKHPMEESQLAEAKRLARIVFERARLTVPSPPAVPVPSPPPAVPV